MKYLKAIPQTNSIICFYIKSLISYSINHKGWRVTERRALAGKALLWGDLGRVGVRTD